jgi:hypothetical protein
MTEATGCATAGCFRGDLTYFESGGVGSWYCPDGSRVQETAPAQTACAEAWDDVPAA